MGRDQIDRVKRLPPQLGVEVGAAGGEPACFEHLVIGQGDFRYVVGELVRVPAGLVVVAVHVDGTENPQRGRQRQFMFERMARKDRVALFDVHLNLTLQPELLEETVNGGDIEIILVFGGLLRLRLHQNGAFEADLVFVLHRHLQEPSGLLAFAFEVGVQQGFIALAPAPKHIVPAVQLVGRIHTGFDRRRGPGKDLRVRVGGRARHKAAVTKEVRGAPKQLGLGAFHLGAEVVDDLFEITQALGECIAFGADVGIVPAEERRVQQVEHFKRHIGLEPRHVHRLAKPRAVKCLAAEGIAAGPRKGMPIGHSKAQVVFHPFAHDHFVRIVVAKGQVRPFWVIGQGLNIFKEIIHVSWAFI